MMPIEQYKDFPSLTNVKLIGTMLRQTPTKSIIHLINMTKVKIG